MTKPRSRGPAGGCLVLGYDRSESSRHAANWVAAELAAHGGKLVIVHACRPQHLPPSPLATARQRHEKGRAIIDELLLDGDDSLFDIELETHVSGQDPASALIAAAKHHNARAIVIGAQQHPRLHEAVGTLTTELLKTSPVPVITVPLSANRDLAAAAGAARRGSRHTLLWL